MKKIMFSKWLFLFWLIISIILLGSGAAMSGYHLVDDHWVLERADNIAAVGWSASAIYFIKLDLGARFRPLYNLLIMAKIPVFGVNMNVWMFADYIECLIAFFLLYAFCRLLGQGKLEGILFAGLSLFGAQITPWYRALNQENEGTLLFSLALFLTALGYAEGSRLHERKWYKAVLVLVVLLCSLMKEAFVLAVPCFAFLVLYLDRQRKRENRKLQPQGGYLLSLLQDVKRNWGYIMALSVIFLIELYIIVFHVGTNQIGYAGISKNDTLQSVLEGMSGIMKTGWTHQYFILGITGLCCFLVSNGSTGIKPWLQKYFWMALFVLYGISSQMLLHAKSGMWERYLLPAVFFVNVAVIYFLRTLDKGTILHAFYALACAVLLCKGVKLSWEMAKSWTNSWAYFGGDVQEGLYSRISEDRPDGILVSMNAGEFDWAVRQWLWHYCGYDLNIVFCGEVDKEAVYDLLIISNEHWNDEYLEPYGIETEDYDAEVGQNGCIIATRKGI